MLCPIEAVETVVCSLGGAIAPERVQTTVWDDASAPSEGIAAFIASVGLCNSAVTRRKPGKTGRIGLA
jgi:hypothetical protein